jgi:tetratricopeptide (TPR) repeat protein
MADCLRILAMIFYAPLRGIREARDRGSVLPIAVCAYLAQAIFILSMQWLAGDRAFINHPSVIIGYLFLAATSLLPIGVVLIPLLALLANTFERRGSFGVVLRQEYGSLASATLYVLIASNLVTVLIALFFHFSGIQGAYVARVVQEVPQWIEMWRQAGTNADQLAFLQSQLSNPALIARGLFLMVMLALFAVGLIEAVRAVFRASVLRAFVIVFLSCLAGLPLALILARVFLPFLGSPLVLLFLFFLLRGYFSDVVGQQRARAAFKQNLEAATINPRDSSAHYNLGLIHQTRGELDQARERFQRAIDIDPDELDAHYQLGRISRAQNRLPEAIGHFEQVVQRDQLHSQHEIWREIGATYLAAGQYSDARDALEKFLDRRTNDPQGLYLIGRAYAGLGDQQEAASSMQACIEAVKTAPAYKYRMEKRWLNEAQQFLKGKRQEAVGTRQ